MEREFFLAMGFRWLGTISLYGGAPQWCTSGRPPACSVAIEHQYRRPEVPLKQTSLPFRKARAHESDHISEVRFRIATMAVTGGGYTHGRTRYLFSGAWKLPAMSPRRWRA